MSFNLFFISLSSSVFFFVTVYFKMHETLFGSPLTTSLRIGTPDTFSIFPKATLYRKVGAECPSFNQDRKFFLPLNAAFDKMPETWLSEDKGPLRNRPPSPDPPEAVRNPRRYNSLFYAARGRSAQRRIISFESYLTPNRVSPTKLAEKYLAWEEVNPTPG